MDSLNRLSAPSWIGTYLPLQQPVKSQIVPLLSGLQRISSIVSSCWPFNFLKTRTALPAPLPIDPDLTIKRLENGLTYYVRPNAYPYPQKAALRLVVRTGYLNETEEERGYAHMVEHLAQIGTAHFAPYEIDRYLDSLGVGWGGDNNAYTSLKETVYMLEIPLDDPETLDKTLFILSEIAGKATLSDEMIEMERAVVIDELQQKRNKLQRYSKNLWQYLLDGTPYPKLRDKEYEIQSIKNCTPEGIRNFYKRWYQPQNMALIAVGDFDGQKTQSLIKKHFGKLSSSQSPATIPSLYPTRHKETRFSCFTDPEWTQSFVEIYFKLPFVKENGQVDLREIKRSLIQELAMDMINARLDEIEEMDAAPFLEAAASKQTVIHGCPNFRLAAQSQEGALPAAFKRLLCEIKRIQQYGFSESELQRAKQCMKTCLEHALQEKDKANILVESCKKHFLEQTPLPSRGALLKAKTRLSPTVSLREVNQWISSVFSEKDCFITTSAPEKQGLTNMTEADLKQIMVEAAGESVDPYAHATLGGPLLKELPAPGAIVERKRHEKANVTEYLLENGLRVFFKPTTFENDFFAIYAQAIHGIRELPLEEQLAAKFVDNFYRKCGLGDFDLASLKEVLTEKQLTFDTCFGSYLTDIGALSGKKDAETAFQAFHLLFTNSGTQMAAFERALKEAQETLRNRHLDPQALFADTILNTNTQNHPEKPSLRFEDLQQIDYETTKRLHAEAFSRPEDFSVVLVGNLEEQVVQGYIERYMASLPKGKEKRINPSYTPVWFPPGVTRKEVYAGKKSACTSLLTFPAPIPDTERAALFSEWSCHLVQTRLQEVLRKQMGKSYTPVCFFLEPPIPHLQEIDPSKALIRISCDPAHLKEVEEAMFQEISLLQQVGPSEQEIEDCKALMQLKQRKRLNTNTGWLNMLATAVLWNRELDPNDSFHHELDAFDAKAAQEQLRHLFPLHNYSIVTLYPEQNIPK